MLSGGVARGKDADGYVRDLVYLRGGIAGRAGAY
jgi:hypothetical protein